MSNVKDTLLSDPYVLAYLVMREVPFLKNTQYTEYHYKYAVSLVNAFFEDNECEELSAFGDIFHNWIATDTAKVLLEQLKQKLEQEEKERLAVGVEAINMENYTVMDCGYNKAPVHGLYRVRCNESNLLGLITNDGVEVLPCIFDAIHFHLDGPIDIKFCGRDYDLVLLGNIPDSIDDNVFIYDKTSAYNIIRSKYDTKTTELLYELLKRNHSSATI